MGNKKLFSVVVAAGGTGGHIFPAVAVVEQLEVLTQQNINVTFMGSTNRMESELIPAMGYRFVGMRIKGLSRIFSVDTLLLPFRVLFSVVKAYVTIKRNKSQVVMCTGAYISFPVGLAAWLSGVPLVVLESNVNPGKSNRKLASKASAVVLAFEEGKKYFPKSLQKRLVVLGNPIRKEVIGGLDQREARKILGLKEDAKTLFVFGGSLGAKTINTAVENFIHSNSNIQVLWQTGKKYEPQSPLPEGVKCVRFIENMGVAYAACDLVLCRSGATTVAELGLLGKAAILVPMPNSATNEQYHNAMHAQETGGAVMVADNEIIKQMKSVVLDILGNEHKIEQMSVAMKKLGKPRAAEEAAQLVLDIGGWVNNGN
ncbi:MAG: undecaprenyldiphospho-muramoylpentapeptide beta-N-acetylglucosaminyltransferase [Ignavibacteria bacterium]|nr:undecaprenyldiphospho-muramoylpentapeptide beta-N-acetylglucosaminyltransferase [Ignavibacteria bacterium]